MHLIKRPCSVHNWPAIWVVIVMNLSCNFRCLWKQLYGKWAATFRLLPDLFNYWRWNLQLYGRYQNAAHKYSVNFVELITLLGYPNIPDFTRIIHNGWRHMRDMRCSLLWDIFLSRIHVLIQMRLAASQRTCLSVANQKWIGHWIQKSPALLELGYWSCVFSVLFVPRFVHAFFSHEDGGWIFLHFRNTST